MKILFQNHIPFAWAHGGCQLLIESVMAGVKKLGAEVEPLRWWDQDQKGDILQLFNFPREEHIYARKKGIKIATYLFLDGFTEKSHLAITLRIYLIRFFRRFAPDIATKQGWLVGQLSDAYIFPSQLDANLGQRLFTLDPARSHVILHGVTSANLPLTNSITNQGKGKYLVSVGTIDKRKNSVLLARAAKRAGTPIVFIGKPYDTTDSYFLEFMSLVDNDKIVYKGFVNEDEKYNLLKDSRGFVTLSRFESGCIAVLEACSLGCRILLPDLAWARGVYNNHASFVDISHVKAIIKSLQKLYNGTLPAMPHFPVQTWQEVAMRYYEVYESMVKSKGMG